MENTIEPIENPTPNRKMNHTTQTLDLKKAMKKYHFTNGIFYVLNL
jgi:hypothetical protein